jgi:hypothetical protein
VRKAKQRERAGGLGAAAYNAKMAGASAPDILLLSETCVKDFMNTLRTVRCARQHEAINLHQ